MNRSQRERRSGGRRSNGRRSRFPTAKSQALYGEAQKYAPAGVQGAGRYYEPFPLFMKKAFGARIWDVDDNEYIDYHGSYGPASLGYNEPRIRRAVIDAMETEGVLFALAASARGCSVQDFHGDHPLCREDDATWRRRIGPALQRGPAGPYLYRAARKILKFEGGYHGWHDELALSVRPSAEQVAASNEMKAIAVSSGALPEHAAEHADRPVQR